MKLSEKIKQLRISNEMTQPELASESGIEQSYLSKLENDKGSPSFEVINKIARVFDLTGLELIKSLSHSYIKNNLAHIPEVAAEYVSIKNEQIKKFKRIYVLASLLLAVGSGLLFFGIKSSWGNIFEYPYQSEGVFKTGETPYQFSKHRIQEIGESAKESEVRRKANRGRIEVKQMILSEERGAMFIIQVEGGHRMYEVQEPIYVQKNKFHLISAVGMMLMVLGLFLFVYNLRYKLVLKGQ